MSLLYTFRRCPYAMRARMALKYAGLNPELREIILRDKPNHMLEISPKGTVPILQLDDGTVIEESIEIMQYALNQNDPDGWLEMGQQNITPYIKQNDQDFKPMLDRYKYPHRYPDEDLSNVEENAVTILKQWNETLSKQTFLLGDQLSMADIALFPFVRQFYFSDPEKFEGFNLPHLKKWLDQNLESNLFQDIMPKVDLWKQGDPPIYFQDVIRA